MGRMAKELDQQREPVFGVAGTDEVLSDLRPVTTGNIVEPQGCIGRAGLRNERLRLFAFLALYRLGFAFVRAFGRAEKATTVDLEIVLPER